MKEASKKQNEKELDGWDLLKKQNNIDRTDSEEDDDFDEDHKSDEDQSAHEDFSSEDGSERESEEQEDSDSDERKSSQLVETDMNILSEPELRERVNRAAYPYFRPIMLDYYVRGMVSRSGMCELIVLSSARQTSL